MYSPVHAIANGTMYNSDFDRIAWRAFRDTAQDPVRVLCVIMDCADCICSLEMCWLSLACTVNSKQSGQLQSMSVIWTCSPYRVLNSFIESTRPLLL